MADTRKYYYLKLKENFYDSEEMILLQNMQDGYLYSDILMKLYLRSLKNNGKLMFKDVIPYTPELLAQVVRHQVGTVKQALHIFQELGLIELMDSGAIYMLDIQNFIGESSTEADRQRKYYNKIKAEKQLEIDYKEQCKKSYKTSTPKIDIKKETELDTDIEIDIKKDNNDGIPNGYQRDNTGTKCLTEYRDKSIEYRDKILDIDKEIELDNNTSLPVPTSPSKKDILLQYETEFEKLWEHYPNKKGKDQAKNKYLLARKQGITYETIAQGLKNYINYIKSENIEEKFIKHGSTWFNQKCWNDDYKISNQTKTEKVDKQMEILKGVHNGSIKVD